MKAITTHFSGPTNTRGARIIVKAEGVKSMHIPFNHGAKDAHQDAARIFVGKLGWLGEYVSATLPNGDRVHVPVHPSATGTGADAWTQGEAL